MKHKSPDDGAGSPLPTDRMCDAARMRHEFERRQQGLLWMVAGGDWTPAAQVLEQDQDIYGSRALANLALGRFPAESNVHLRWVAAWFDHPHPTGRAHDGECDFVAIKFADALHRGGLLQLEERTRHVMREFLLRHDFISRYLSENHALIFRAARYLAAMAMPEESFPVYGKRGSDLAVEDAQWLMDFLRYRARRGWGEFDSNYLDADWECLAALYDACGRPHSHRAPREEKWSSLDVDLKHLARMMMDLLLADMAVDSLNGMYCGARGRVYPAQVLDHAAESTYALQHLFFGTPPPCREHIHIQPASLLCAFRPDDAVLEMAGIQPRNCEVRERKHLHNILDMRPERPLPGSIRKYTWRTPHYVMGAIQWQDSYPPDNVGSAGGNPPSWYAHHQQHQWDLSFLTSTRARLFTHHPGLDGEHNHWTGDRGCGCGHFLQHRSALLALYDIPADQPCQFIHAYLPRDVFDEVREESGIVFVRAGEAFGSLRLIGDKPYYWCTTGEWRGREILSEGARHGVVCEAGLSAEYGSFDAFCRTIHGNTLCFDSPGMTLEYCSARVGRLRLGRSERLVNGAPINLRHGTYDSPCLRSVWDSGVIEMIGSRRRVVLDFMGTRHGENEQPCMESSEGP